MTNEEAEQAIKDLKAHFREPVMPISRYCSALREWKEVIGKRDGYADTEEINGQHVRTFYGLIRSVFLEISKSCLLLRLLYDGESIRTEPCPIHKGTWSGCAFNDPGCFSKDYPQGCMAGSNVTGWLPLAETNEEYKQFWLGKPQKELERAKVRRDLFQELVDGKPWDNTHVERLKFAGYGVARPEEPYGGYTNLEKHLENAEGDITYWKAIIAKGIGSE